MFAMIHKLIHQFDLQVPKGVLGMTDSRISFLSTLKLSTLCLKSNTINKECIISFTTFFVKLHCKPLCTV